MCTHPPNQKVWEGGAGGEGRKKFGSRLRPSQHHVNYRCIEVYGVKTPLNVIRRVVIIFVASYRK